jgi:hypothetical protein
MSNPGSVIQRQVAAPAFQLAPPPANPGPQIAGDAIAEFGHALARARDQSQLVNARLGYSQKVDDLYQQYTRDPDPASAPARFAKAAQDAAADYYDGFYSDDARAAFTLDAGQMAESRRISMMDLSFKRESDQAVANLDAAGEKFARDAAFAANPAERQTAIDSYAQSVMGVSDAGLIGHEDAGRRVQAFKEKLALYDGRTAVDSDPVRAKKDLAKAGYLPDLDPLQRLQLRGSAEAAVKAQERAAAQAKAQATLAARFSLEDLKDAAGSGLKVDPVLFDRARADVAASGDPRLVRQLEDIQRSVSVTDGLRGATPQHVESVLNGIAVKANAEGATPADVAEYTGARRMLETMTARLASDPLSYAASQGVTRIEPLNLAGQESALGWQNRIRAARVAAQHYGIQPRYFTAAESAQIKTQLANSADPGVRMATLHMLTQGLGTRAVPELARLGISPALVTAGGLMTGGAHHARIAQDIVAGESAFAATAKGGDGQSILRPTDTARNLSVTGSGHFFGGVTLPQGLPQIRQAAAMLPGEAARISAAADAIYAARAPSLGLTGKDAAIGNGKDLYERALQEAAGAWFDGNTQMGGMSHYRKFPVLVPDSIAADSFEGLVRHLTAADLAAASVSGAPPVDADGAQLTPDFIKQRWLVTAGNGLYELSTTDPTEGKITPVRDRNHHIYHLDFAKALALLQARGGGR